MRGSQQPQLSGNFFDVSTQFPGEGESFAPHFTLKTRVMVEGEMGEPDYFVSANGVPVKYEEFLNRKGKPEINNELKVQQIVGHNYKLASKSDAHAWAYLPSETQLSGKITDLKTDFYTRPNNKVVNIVNLGILDEEYNEYYRINFRFNYTTNKFFNSLLSLGEDMIGQTVKITLSQTESNGVKYSNIYFNILKDGKFEGVRWRFNKNEEGEWVDESGVVMPTASKEATSEFILSELKRLEEIFDNQSELSNDSNTSPVDGDETDAENAEHDGDDDLPF